MLLKVLVRDEARVWMSERSLVGVSELRGMLADSS